MYARGEFELGSSGGLTVPQTAVVVRDGFSYVARVGADNRVAQVKVQTGRIVGDQIEILSGVKPEDKRGCQWRQLPCRRRSGAWWMPPRQMVQSQKMLPPSRNLPLLLANKEQIQ
jgi:hypothetical protein